MTASSEQTASLRTQRLTELAGCERKTQSNLKKNIEEKTAIIISKSTISDAFKGKMTEDTAKLIASVFPGVRWQWLLGLDDYKTEAEHEAHQEQELRKAERLYNQFRSLAYQRDVEKVWSQDDAFSALLKHVYGIQRSTAGKDELGASIYTLEYPDGNTKPIHREYWTFVCEELFDLLELKLHDWIYNDNLACPHCGKTNKADALFCSYCGKKI